MRVNSLFGLTVKLICILPIYQFWFWVKEDYSLNCGTPCIIYFYTFVQKRKKKRKEALYHLCLYIYTKKGKIKEKKEGLYHDTRLLGHMAARKKAGGPSSAFLAGGPPPHLSSPLLMAPAAASATRTESESKTRQDAQDKRWLQTLSEPELVRRSFFLASFPPNLSGMQHRLIALL